MGLASYAWQLTLGEYSALARLEMVGKFVGVKSRLAMLKKSDSVHFQ